jgi:hypothetical protein
MFPIMILRFQYPILLCAALTIQTTKSFSPIKSFHCTPKMHPATALAMGTHTMAIQK